MCILGFQICCQVTFQKDGPVSLLSVGLALQPRQLSFFFLFFFQIGNILLYFLLKIFGVGRTDKQTCWNVGNGDLSLPKLSKRCAHLVPTPNGNLAAASRVTPQKYNTYLKDVSTSCLLGHEKIAISSLLAGVLHSSLSGRKGEEDRLHHVLETGV